MNGSAIFREAEEILAGLAGRRAAFQLIFGEDGSLLGAAVSREKAGGSFSRL